MSADARRVCQSLICDGQIWASDVVDAVIQWLWYDGSIRHLGVRVSPNVGNAQRIVDRDCVRITTANVPSRPEKADEVWVLSDATRSSSYEGLDLGRVAE